MSASNNWDFVSMTPGQRTVFEEHPPNAEQAANHTANLPTEPSGIYAGINSIEKHEELVHFFGGGVHFSNAK